MRYSSITLPEHNVPSPVYPAAHVHSYDAPLMLHSALGSQGFEEQRSPMKKWIFFISLCHILIGQFSFMASAVVYNIDWSPRFHSECYYSWYWLVSSVVWIVQLYIILTGLLSFMDSVIINNINWSPQLYCECNYIQYRLVSSVIWWVQSYMVLAGLLSFTVSAIINNVDWSPQLYCEFNYI